MAEPGKEPRTRLVGSAPEVTTVAVLARVLEPLSTRTGLCGSGTAITWLVTVLMVVLPNWPSGAALMKVGWGAAKLGLVKLELDAAIASLTLEVILLSQGFSAPHWVGSLLTLESVSGPTPRGRGTRGAAACAGSRGRITLQGRTLRSREGDSPPFRRQLRPTLTFISSLFLLIQLKCLLSVFSRGGLQQESSTVDLGQAEFLLSSKCDSE